MSRFDDELTRVADNAWQMNNLPSPVTQGFYDQQDTINLDSGFGAPEMAPPVGNDVAAWTSNQPMHRMLQVTDLDASGMDVQGGPGSSAVFASATDVIDDSLYSVYKASREIRDAIEAGTDFDFDGLFTASRQCEGGVRQASNDQWLSNTIGVVASLANEIETELVNTGDYRQAHVNLQEFETFLDDLNKYASGEFVAASAQCSECSGAGCENCEMGPASVKMTYRQATNGNQETLQQDDVRALDNVGPYMNVGPDATVNVEEPQEVNGEDAGYVNYYNDGAETGITPGQEPHKQEVFPNDQTNPALVPYAGTVAAREKIFEALQVVERLEKLGMVNSDQRAKHIAKFEQMSDAKLAGFKASLDMLEESGARQPRSQKVASGNNRMPEMGRLTTASTSNRQSISADDWLMTL